MGNRIIGPFLSDEAPNRLVYLQLLEEAVTPTMIASLGNDSAKYDSVLQQDGTSSHFYLALRKYLDTKYSGR